MSFQLPLIPSPHPARATLASSRRSILNAVPRHYTTEDKRSRSLIRALSFLLYLEASRAGLTIDQAARQFDVSTRTIRRDLIALQMAGIPIVDDRDEVTGRVTWRVLPWRRLA